MKKHDRKYLAFHAISLKDVLFPTPSRMSVDIVGFVFKLFLSVAALLLVVNFIEQAQAVPVDWRGPIKTIVWGLFLVFIAICVRATALAILGDEKSSTLE